MVTTKSAVSMMDDPVACMYVALTSLFQPLMPARTPREPSSTSEKYSDSTPISYRKRPVVTG